MLRRRIIIWEGKDMRQLRSRDKDGSKCRDLRRVIQGLLLSRCKRRGEEGRRRERKSLPLQVWKEELEKLQASVRRRPRTNDVKEREFGRDTGRGSSGKRSVFRFAEKKERKQIRVGNRPQQQKKKKTEKEKHRSCRERGICTWRWWDAAERKNVKKKKKKKEERRKKKKKKKKKKRETVCSR
jgi:hypothetical protein